MVDFRGEAVKDYVKLFSLYTNSNSNELSSGQTESELCCPTLRADNPGAKGQKCIVIVVAGVVSSILSSDSRWLRRTRETMGESAEHDGGARGSDGRRGTQFEGGGESP